MEVGNLVFVRSAERVARITGYDSFQEVMTYRFTDGNQETITVELVDTPENEEGEFVILDDDYFGYVEETSENEEVSPSLNAILFNCLKIMGTIGLIIIITSVVYNLVK
jgi:predicted RNA-binding protein (virulence factor B family)